MHRLAILLGLLLSVPAWGQGEAAWRLAGVISGDALEGDAASGVTRGLVSFNVDRADAKGGQATFEVACGETGRPAPRAHAHRYECAWSFDADVTVVGSGQSITLTGSVRRVDRTRCREVVEGAPILDVQAGGPEAALEDERRGAPFDLAVFPDAPTPPLLRRMGARSAAGETSGSLEIRVGAVEPEPGRRGFFNVVFGSTLNSTLHVIYVYEADEAAPEPPPLDDAVAVAEGILGIAVGKGRPDPALDLDRDGRVNSRDAVLVLQAAETAAAEAARHPRHPGGPPPAAREVAVPRVTGLTALDVKTTLLRARLEAVIEPPRGAVEADVQALCTNQSPEAGRRARRGSLVAVRMEAPHEEPPVVVPPPPQPEPPHEHPVEPPVVVPPPPPQPEPPHEHPVQPPVVTPEPPVVAPQPPEPQPPQEQPEERRRISVPDVAGLKEAEARAKLGDQFQVEIAANRPESPDHDHEHTVLSQEPAAGTRVRRGAKVVLTLYGAHEHHVESFAVMDVLGLTEDAARAKLGDHFQVEIAANRPDAPDHDRELVVASQDPAAGTQGPRGTRVVLTLYGEHHEEQFVVGDVLGLTEAAARAKLGEHFQVEIASGQPAPPSAERAQTVAAQDPAAGGKGPHGTRVVLTLHGPYVPPIEMVTVPDVVGMRAKDAKYKLSDGLTAKFHVAPVDPPDESREFTIASQSPPAGTSVEKGSVVVLKVYRTLPPREEEPPAVEPEPPHVEPEPPHVEPDPPHEEPPHVEPEPPPDEPPQVADPFVGSWKGTCKVHNPGSQVVIGAAGEELVLQILVTKDDDGSYSVAFAGREETARGVRTENRLVISWSEENGRRELLLDRHPETLDGSLRAVTPEGEYDGLGEVHMRRGE